MKYEDGYDFNECNDLGKWLEMWVVFHETNLLYKKEIIEWCGNSEYFEFTDNNERGKRKQLKGKGDGQIGLRWDSKSFKPDFCNINFLLELGYVRENPYDFPPTSDDIDKSGWFFTSDYDIIIYVWRTDKDWEFQDGYLLCMKCLKKWYDSSKKYKQVYVPTRNPYARGVAYWTVNIPIIIDWLPSQCYKKIPSFFFEGINKNVKKLIEKNKKGLDKWISTPIKKEEEINWFD